MQIAHRTELGYVRTRNEDAVLARQLGEQAWLIGVADGMGGHPAGDVASKLAVEVIEGAVAEELPDAEATLTHALLAAHEAVLATADAEPAYMGMGTTAAIAYVKPTEAVLGHVGDSRIYLVRGEVAERLTHDHNRHGYLTQAIGVPHLITPETGVVPLRPGDRLLVCTDGLSGLVSDEAIGALAGLGTVSDACDRLVDAALAAGGYDNVTVVIAEP